MDFVSILAAGGGGSSGFGGGGGGGGVGGGGGFGGGGTGGGGGGDTPEWVFVVVFVIFMLIVTWYCYRFFKAVRPHWQRARYRARLDKRSEATLPAAAEAAEDGAHFAPEVVEAAARELFVDLQSAWDARDHDKLRALAGGDLYVEWERRLADFAAKGWHNRVEVSRAPMLRYVGLENREDDAEDRVVVFVECRVKDYVLNRRGKLEAYKNGEDSKKVTLREYWTLAWTSAGWRVDSIQSEAEGGHHLDAPLVPVPWSDGEQLHGEAIVELAATDAAPAGAPAPGDLVDVEYGDDARAAALDLSLADGRFAPAVLEAAVRRAVPAWVAAVDGADDRLLRVATPEAARALLYPDPEHDRARLVIRGGVVDDVRITALDVDAEPVEMTVEVALRGRRYVEDRNTAAVLSGSRDRETTSAERLLFALDDADPAVPWRVVGRGECGASGASGPTSRTA